MTDQELAEIDEWFHAGMILGISKDGSIQAALKAFRLIAELRHWRGNE